MPNKIFLVLDFEAFFGKDCNIKKLAGSQYVTHPDFEVLSLSYKTPDMAAPKFVGGPKAVKKFFDKLRPVQDRIVLCGHNLYFDAYVAMIHYNFVAGFMVDTLCMGQALDSHEGPLDLKFLSEKYGAPQPKIEMPDIKGKYWHDLDADERHALQVYNDTDVAATEHIARIQLEQFPAFELKVIDLTLRMFIEPMLIIDAEKAQAVVDEEQEIKRSTRVEAIKQLGYEPTPERIEIMGEIVRSNDKFAALLEGTGFEVPMKWSEKQEKEVPAFAQADLPFQRLIKSDDPKLSAFMQARLRSKSSINETRAKALLERADRPMPIGLMYCSAHTMRWGGTDKVNSQNLPRDGRLRNCLTAPKGHVLVIVDASQIEARDCAASSEQWDLCDEFREYDRLGKGNVPSPYRKMAAQIYRLPPEEVTKDQRFVGKTAVLGAGYQMGAAKFQMTLEVGMMGPPMKISMQEAQQAINTFRTKNYKIKQHWSVLQSLIPNMLDNGQRVEHQNMVIEPGGTVLMPNGLRLHYPGLTYKIHPDFGTPEFEYWPYHKQYKKPVREKLYGGKQLEHNTQCRTRIMTTEHMMKLARYYRVVMMAHDEIVMCVPTNKADKCLRDALEIMSIPPRWNEHCPLAAEGEISPHYVKP